MHKSKNSITFEIKNNMSIFRKEGTKLPNIPVGTECIIPHRDGKITEIETSYNHNNFVSYGYKEYKGEIYILAERIYYPRSDYHMFKESDIIKLADNVCLPTLSKED